MLTTAQWIVVGLVLLLVIFLSVIGGAVPALIIGVPAAGIVATFYWWQGKGRRSS